VYIAIALTFISTFVWLGIANAKILMPFIRGNSQTIPLPPAWSDPATAIELIAPVAGVSYHSPIELVGLSQTFEGNVNIRLLDAAGEVLAERNAIGGSADGFDWFHTYIRFTVTEVQTGTVEVFEESAKDGSRLTEILVPVTLLPGQRFVDLNFPEVGAALCNPVVLNGYSNTFEAHVSVDVRQRDTSLLTQTFTMGGNLGFYADFSVGLTVPITKPTPLLLSAFESSPKDGEPIDLARIPISLYPDGSALCP
jgi:hypothetical protein